VGATKTIRKIISFISCTLLTGVVDGVVQITKHTDENAREAEPAQYDIMLLQQPTAVVQVDVTSGDAGIIVNQTIRFSPSSWSTPQAFEVFVTDDDIIQPSPYTSYILLTASSLDDNFKLPTATLSVRVDNQDVGR
jgi:hypothetical protein